MDVILIDGKNFCWRHGWTRRMLRASTGFPTGVIYGVLSGMLRLNRLFPNAAMVFCWDGPRTDKSWRHKMCATYKANRKKGGDPPQEVQDVHMQIPAISVILAQMGYLQISINHLEADDLIGVVATSLRKRVENIYIYSSDKDFFQLKKKNIHVVPDIDKSKQCAPIREKDIQKRFGILVKDWLKFRALVGDKSDNIKNVKGLGPKTALKMLASGCDPSKEKCTVDKLSGAWKEVRLNYRLLRIVKHIDDKRLPASVKKELSGVIEAINKAKTKKLFRSDEGKSGESYKKVLKLLSQYELVTLIEDRARLWRLP